MSLNDILEKSKRIAQANQNVSQPVSINKIGFPDEYSDVPPDIDSLLDEDTTFNFRLNSQLKKEFALICKRDHLSASAALKRYMTACVRIGVLK